MIIQRDLLFDPFGRIVGKRRDDAGVAHRMSEIHLDKSPSMRFVGNAEPEDGLIHLLTERNVIGRLFTMEGIGGTWVTSPKR